MEYRLCDSITWSSRLEKTTLAPAGQELRTRGAGGREMGVAIKGQREILRVTELLCILTVADTQAHMGDKIAQNQRNTFKHKESCRYLNYIGGPC